MKTVFHFQREGSETLRESLVKSVWQLWKSIPMELLQWAWGNSDDSSNSRCWLLPFFFSVDALRNAGVPHRKGFICMYIYIY